MPLFLKNQASILFSIKEMLKSHALTRKNINITTTNKDSI